MNHELETLRAEVERLKRGAKMLGSVIHNTARATGRETRKR